MLSTTFVRPTKMSFLKSEATQQVNRIQASATPQGNPVGYESSETLVQLRPVPTPTSTQSFDHNKHSAQREICEQLVAEEPQLFEGQNTIVRQVTNEKQYKQRQQFSSKVSVESMCEAMDKHNVVLKCSFVRPGFCASNTCLMCKSEDLKQAMLSEKDEFNLKKVKLSLASDSELSPQNGTMFLSLVQKADTGKHMFYSLDYHIAEQHDKKLFSQ